jgi:hypothetical protein
MVVGLLEVECPRDYQGRAAPAIRKDVEAL